MTRSLMLKCLVISFLLVSCSQKNKNTSISIQWENNKAVGIFIPQQFILTIPKDSVEGLLHIHLKESNTPVLGEYILQDDGLLFHPLIPFTRGLKYEVRLQNKLLDEILIPSLTERDAPKVLSVYPTSDTLPQNVLKFYISFSKPMREDHALSHIRLIKNGNDTLSSVFLDLQQELWNNDRTMLTLWFDPGRIKRGLQPNELLGPPLQPNENYQLIISKDWQDEEGLSLARDHHKNFFTAFRDSISPDPEQWTLHIPRAASKEQLSIDFHESLDHVLSKNTMNIKDAGGNYVKGVFRTNGKSNSVTFAPDIEWSSGAYKLEIESRLEDLAGNNLVRLFDADMSQQQREQKDIFTKEFRIAAPAK